MRRAALAVALVALAAGDAHAWHPVNSFAKTANEGGGSGMYFTGSPRQRGYDCTICHIDGDRTLSIEIDSPITAGTYTPGMRYDVVVRLAGEHTGGGSVANVNTFLVEPITDAGERAGDWFGTDEAKLGAIDGGRVLAARGGGAGFTEWTFVWTAPPAGTGPVTMYFAAVDGNGAGNAETGATDPLGDDTAELVLRLCESSPGCAPVAGVEEPPDAAAHCALIGGGAGGAGTAVVLLAALALVCARRRRAHALVIAVLGLGGCFDPTVAGECPSRVCGDAGLALIDAPPGNGGCRENWVCTPWEAPLGSDEATRTCIDTNAEGTEECKPAVGPVTLPPLDLNYYKCQVSPILQRGCSMMACHGTDEGRTYRIYARGRLRNDEIVNRTGTCIPQTGTVNLQEAGSGTVMCEGWLPHTDLEWKKSFDSARSFMLGIDEPADSELLRQPTTGGLPHVEVKPFTPDGGDYQTVRAWLGGASQASCNTGAN